MKLVTVNDDPNQDRAYNVYECDPCMMLCKESVWYEPGTLWIDLNNKVDFIKQVNEDDNDCGRNPKLGELNDQIILTGDFKGPVRTIKQRIPNYFEGYVAEVESFETLDDLLAIEWVNRFDRFAGFKGYALTRIMSQTFLIAEIGEGNQFWLIGSWKSYDEETELGLEYHHSSIKHYNVV
tara:strand:+ start:928 stop:1467 length:540 start_codon:yes stop_codon:yes gene_type:complete